MPEAEEVITDLARHATIYARDLWQRHKKNDARNSVITLRDVAQRLDLLITAAFGTSYPIRIAQAPAPPTFLTKLFKKGERPRVQTALPATDGVSIWLPDRLPDVENQLVLARYRVLALLQAMRAFRRSANFLGELDNEIQRSVFIVLEAHAANKTLMELLPGMRAALKAFRIFALARRPALQEFPAHRLPLEELVRSILSDVSALPVPDMPADSVEMARTLAEELSCASQGSHGHGQMLFKDLWTGDLFPAPNESALSFGNNGFGNTQSDPKRPRSARLSRRPDVREPTEDEDDTKQGAWMVQTSQPHEQAEDPIGMQRPTDRDESTAAEEFADSLSELPEARLVSTPGRPKEVLLSDDLPASRAKHKFAATMECDAKLQYPEWDYRIGAYQEPGVTVHVLPSAQGPQEWVNRTLNAHRSMLNMVRRRFEMLRAQRVRLRKQLEGEEIDLEAYVDSYSDFRAGAPMAQALYQSSKPAKRDMAIVLLIDISGSTDGWISADKRVIDVEREALLLVSIALQGMAEPYSVIGFSGEGPHGVTIRTIKSFEEPHSNDVARRIAALEPEHYTRAGAAIRHATALLMRQSARHRLLLLLSDGKPNDIDDYEGRYGVEDMRQAVTEAKLQGINPFCLTIDRQAAHYLPAVFGAYQYALLPKPALLPVVLLEWMKRLVAA
jgi:nitric oxide reductase NorD protein